MLQQLSIRNFVLIDALELRLEPGFNVLTGETGAGKSIVVDALGLVLGHRARAEIVRPGADEATVEALFGLAPAGTGAEVIARLEAAGIDASDGEIVVRRVVGANGRSRAYLNGRLCTTRELAELGRLLADVTSQHESVHLCDPAAHLDYLDEHAGTMADRGELRSRVIDLHAVDAKLRAMRERERDRADREAFLRYQLEAIDRLAPQPDEPEVLAQELAMLKHATRLKSAAIHAAELFEGDDGIADELGRVAAELAAAAEIDESLRDASDEVQSCWSRLREVGRDLGRYSERVEDDPARVEEIQERLFQLEKLLRRHGPTMADMLAERDRIERELADLNATEARLPELEAERAAALAQAAVIARRLSERRAEAAEELASAIAAELAELGMPGARVTIEVSPRERAEPGEPSVDGTRLSETGIDRVQLLLSPNKGMVPRPLRETASGGELSRVLLALKRVAARRNPRPSRTRLRNAASTAPLPFSLGIQVLDEVDAGVGGETADRIGRAIAAIASERQVLCITHLANIAAYADAHFVVTKTSDSGRAASTIARADGDARIAELARMLTGATRTGSTQRAARDLLGAARRVRNRRAA